MFRAFCPLVLCCVLSSVGVAQEAQVRPNPVRVQTSATWEYGELIYAARPIGPIWLSADTMAVALVDSAENYDPCPGCERVHSNSAPLLRVLNVLGARGWELVSAPSSSREITYVFKREVSPAARSGTTH
jgi:hypothetical protein